MVEWNKLCWTTAETFLLTDDLYFCHFRWHLRGRETESPERYLPILPSSFETSLIQLSPETAPTYVTNTRCPWKKPCADQWLKSRHLTAKRSGSIWLTKSLSPRLSRGCRVTAFLSQRNQPRGAILLLHLTSSFQRNCLRILRTSYLMSFPNTEDEIEIFPSKIHSC